MCMKISRFHPSNVNIFHFDKWIFDMGKIIPPDVASCRRWQGELQVLRQVVSWLATQLNFSATFTSQFVPVESFVSIWRSHLGRECQGWEVQGKLRVDCDEGLYNNSVLSKIKLEFLARRLKNLLFLHIRTWPRSFVDLLHQRALSDN